MKNFLFFCVFAGRNEWLCSPTPHMTGVTVFRTRNQIHGSVEQENRTNLENFLRIFEEFSEQKFRFFPNLWQFPDGFSTQKLSSAKIHKKLHVWPIFGEFWEWEQKHSNLTVHQFAVHENRLVTWTYFVYWSWNGFE